MATGLTLGGIFLVLLSALLIHYLSRVREREKTAETARAKLRSSFSEVLSGLANATADPFVLLSAAQAAQAAHDAALLEYRPYVPSRDLDAYDVACGDFRRLRDSVESGITSFYPLIVAGSTPSSSSNALSPAIERILAYASR